MVQKIYRRIKNRISKILISNSGYFHRKHVSSSLAYKNDILFAGLLKNKKDKSNFFNLRRNIHRIEKGLSYNKIKPVFAEGYIYETVEIASDLKNNGGIDLATYEWTYSVLNRYFELVDITNPIISKSRNIFLTLPKEEHKTYSYFPYKFMERTTSNLEYEELLKFSLQRRSVRFFKPLKVKEEDLNRAFEIAKLAPSACNRQSFRFLYFDDHELVNKISKVPGGVSGYELHNIIVVVGDYSGYFNERDVNAPVIDASLATMAFMYGCESVGLSTVCINWPNVESKDKKIREYIKLEDYEFVVMMIGLGYGEEDGKIPYSKKRDKDFLLINKRCR